MTTMANLQDEFSIGSVLVLKNIRIQFFNQMWSVQCFNKIPPTRWMMIY